MNKEQFSQLCYLLGMLKYTIINGSDSISTKCDHMSLINEINHIMNIIVVDQRAKELKEVKINECKSNSNV